MRRWRWWWRGRVEGKEEEEEGAVRVEPLTTIVVHVSVLPPNKERKKGQLSVVSMVKRDPTRQ